MNYLSHEEFNQKKEDIKKALFAFNAEFGHFPSSKEIDGSELFHITSRSIQRSFGGLVAFRKEAGIPEQEFNQASGPVRSKMAGIINRRSNAYEAEIYKKLISMFGERNVHREHLFDEPKTRRRCDYWVYNKSGDIFLADMFFAKDRHNFIGCLNHKMRKHNGSDCKKPTYFVSVNPNINIQDAMKNKKIQLEPNWKVISYADFLKEIKANYL